MLLVIDTNRRNRRSYKWVSPLQDDNTYALLSLPFLLTRYGTSGDRKDDGASSRIKDSIYRAWVQSRGYRTAEHRSQRGYSERARGEVVYRS